MQNLFRPAVFLSLIVIMISSCKDDPDPVEDRPIERLELTVDSLSGDSMMLSWEMSVDTRFDSYELYRHSSSGFDRDNGTFIHVETERSTNHFTDKNLAANQTFFYRLYNINSDGSAIGSNVVSETTPAAEIIENGSFESLQNDVPVDWTLVSNVGNSNNSISVVNDATDGNNALKIYHAEENGCWEQWINQKLDIDDFSPDQKYVLTFDYKADFKLSSVNAILRNSEMDIWVTESLNYQPQLGWQQATIELTMPNNIGSNNPSLSIHFCEDGVHNIWLDNVSLR